MNKYMKIANDCAHYGANCGQGGPFGAVIVDKKGNILGMHKGLIHYTIGQRKGLRNSQFHALICNSIKH